MGVASTVCLHLAIFAGIWILLAALVVTQQALAIWLDRAQSAARASRPKPYRGRYVRA